MTITRRRVLLGAAVPLGIGLAVGPARRARAQSGRLIRGAGATFPEPLYRRWIEAFNSARPDLDIEYDAVGSGEGVSRFVTGSVDFAASDAAMSDEEIALVEGGVRMIPATAGMVSVAYHLPETPGQLRLTRDAVAGIFAGDITRWDDPRIAQANPDLALPNRTIAVVARLDSSGTTFAFTNFLSAASEAWRATHGAATRIDWPKRAMLAPGNEGVAARLLQSFDSIGYVEHGFASRLGLAQAAIENRSGEFVLPSQASGEAAVAGSADLFPEDLRLFIADPPGAGAYPITTFSWLLLYATYGDPAVREAVAEFVRFGLTEGQAMAAELGFLPLAPSVADRGMRALESLT